MWLEGLGGKTKGREMREAQRDEELKYAQGLSNFGQDTQARLP